ncbi:hypothetical protein G3I51_13480 [Streptomyces sp. SID9944]|nr:hypothetical protein [Streptomyces sp. SID9944]
MSHYTGSVPDLEPADDWRMYGACRSHGEPDIWFAPSRGDDARAQIREA